MLLTLFPPRRRVERNFAGGLPSQLSWLKGRFQ